MAAGLPRERDGMARLFGTDGIRGIANEKITCELALKVGAAGAFLFAGGAHTPRILVGADTRKSCDMLVAALCAGICSVGGEAVQIGVIPTPGLSYLVKRYGADAAVMVSASHNSMAYNGLKWFDHFGHKLSDDLEDEIERLLNEPAQLPRPVGGDVGQITTVEGARADYVRFLQSVADEQMNGMTIALDCANGAASGIAREVFAGLGANVLCMADEPDGTNINDQCGSTHPERLQAFVLAHGADAGFAFDGDADRLIAVDECGQIVDGDRMMGICAIDMRARGVLKDNTLVVTVMSNLGLRHRMREADILLEETAVGDRYVLARMLERGYNLGGEQSGHILFTDHHTTGDGMLSAIQLLNVLRRSGVSFSALCADIPIYPQVLVNVRLQEERMAAALKDDTFNARIADAKQALGDKGRVLVRASGTEPLIRIMLEGPTADSILAYAQAIARVLEKDYGGTIKQ